jgi:hypothetical protein
MASPMRLIVRWFAQIFCVSILESQLRERPTTNATSSRENPAWILHRLISF